MGSGCGRAEYFFHALRKKAFSRRRIIAPFHLILRSALRAEGSLLTFIRPRRRHPERDRFYQCAEGSFAHLSTLVGFQHPASSHLIRTLRYTDLMLKRICVFCGSSDGNDSAYFQAAQKLGQLLAEREIELVYGGGKVGLMGALADACLSNGGRVIGVIPQMLVDKEIAHPNLTELRIVGSMHERKALMADLAEAFIALPGGYGTWEEFFEVLTWTQLGLQRKPCAVLNVNGYYDSLLAMTRRAHDDNFLRDVHRDLILSDTDPARLLTCLDSYEMPRVAKWIDRTTR